MNKRMIMLMAAVLALLSASSQVTFSGGDAGIYTPKEIVLSNNHSSLNKIYVLHNTDGVSMTFNSSTGERATWNSYYYRNGNLVMDTITDIRWDGMGTTLNRVIPNIGYKITEGTTPFHCWVVNYADYEMELNGMSLSDDSSCDLLSFIIDGHADPIYYDELEGNRKLLDREIMLSYKTLVWNDNTESWGETVVIDTFPSLAQGISIAPPLCDTKFTLTGDRFLKEWPIDEKTYEIEYSAKAVNCVSTAYYLDDQGNYLLDEQGNKVKLDGELSGGSAPVRILFSGDHTDGVAYSLWEIARDQNFEDVILQFYQKEVDYTFMETGDYYVRYMVANDDGSCKSYGDTYTINVGVSELQIPNIFMEMWRVSYKSLVEFHCWIFNRWGNLVYEYTDPAGGWDGTYRGKPVDTGVYYYVVTALGSDGKKHNRSGDINVLNHKGTRTPEGGMVN